MYTRLCIALLLSLMILCILSLLLGPVFSTAILSYRFQRIALAIIAGSSLAASGASLQVLFQNPLADPHLFGISGGAALGATLVIAFCGSNSILPGSGAILGALGAFLIVFFFVNKLKTSLSDAILIGVLINAVAGSLITLLKTILPATKTQSVLFWLMGSLGVIESSHFFIIIPLWLIGLGILWWKRSELELLSFGILESTIVGVHTEAVIKSAIIANCILIGNVVAFAGIIGFIGLVIPQMVRLIAPDFAFVLPLAILIGALALVGFDMLSRLSFYAFSTEIPVGALTSLFLSPVFFMLLIRKEYG